VGVARSVKQTGLASQPDPEVWQPAAQTEHGGAQTLAIHSTAASAVLIPWLRSQIVAVDPDLPAPEILTMHDRMSTLIASQIFVMRLLAVFALIATVLAAVGMYSVLVYSVERRTHEIGIRIALGARGPDIMRLIIGRGLKLTVAGAALGVAGALGLTRYLESLLYGVKPHDPTTLALGCTLLILTAVGAAWLPARKATDQDATTTLRAE
jgi:ABC-type antimicrobial peptide transport system permease subunit